MRAGHGADSKFPENGSQTDNINCPLPVLLSIEQGMSSISSTLLSVSGASQLYLLSTWAPTVKMVEYKPSLCTYKATFSFQLFQVLLTSPEISWNHAFSHYICLNYSVAYREVDLRSIKAPLLLALQSRFTVLHTQRASWQISAPGRSSIALWCFCVGNENKWLTKTSQTQEYPEISVPVPELLML